MKTVTIQFDNAEDAYWAEKQINEQIKKGDGNQIAGASASILLCALSRAKSVNGTLTRSEAEALGWSKKALETFTRFDEKRIANSCNKKPCA